MVEELCKSVFNEELIMYLSDVFLCEMSLFDKKVFYVFVF